MQASFDRMGQIVCIQFVKSPYQFWAIEFGQYRTKILHIICQNSLSNLAKQVQTIELVTLHTICHNSLSIFGK